MASTAEISFRSDHRDLCVAHGTGAGFRFAFSCNRCQDTWRSPFEAYTGGAFGVSTPRQLVCPQCQRETHASAFCPHRGHRLARQDTCSSCGAPLPAGAAFGPDRGTRR